MANSSGEQNPMDLNTNVNVNVTVDVTRIVKYLSCAGIIIVGIIFGTKYWHRMLKDGLIDL